MGWIVISIALLYKMLAFEEEIVACQRWIGKAERSHNCVSAWKVLSQQQMLLLRFSNLVKAILVELPSTQQVVDRLCMMKQVFENHDGSWSLIDDILLAWNSCAFLGLRPFSWGFCWLGWFGYSSQGCNQSEQDHWHWQCGLKFKIITEMM